MMIFFSPFILLISVSDVAWATLQNGVNFQPSYYNDGNVTFGWDLLGKYSSIARIRIEIEPDKASQGKQWIQEARDHGYDVIATYHKATVLGSDDAAELASAANWWVENYENLRPEKGDFLINLMNEWGSHDQTAESYSSAYNAAISILRSVYNRDVIIDVPGWGQNTHVAMQASPLLIDQKIILSAHIYPQGNQDGRYNVPSDMDELYSTGRPCIVGEFGTIGNGDVDVPAVVNRAKEIGFLGVFAWAWNGDGGEMNMVSPKWLDNATSSTYTESAYFPDMIALL